MAPGSTDLSITTIKTYTNVHIAIAGNIGSGKTTLTTMLAKHYGWIPRFEPVDINPYLEDYYKDIARWSFCLEVYFLKQRFRDLLEIRKSDRTVVQDRSIYEGVYVFTANNRDMGNLSDRDYETYMELFEIMTDVAQLPDLMIYLRASVPHLVKNIQKRFGVLPGLVEQGNILRITDIGRRAGGVHDHSAAVSASSRLAVRIIIVILGFGFFDLTLLCVPHDHLIDLTQHFQGQALAEIHHQRRIKGQLFVIIARIPAEILKIWGFLNLKRGFLVRIAILRLNDAGSQGQTQRLGHIAFPVCE